MLKTHLDDVQSFVDGSLIIERKASIDFCRNFTGDNLEDFFAKFDE